MFIGSNLQVRKYFQEQLSIKLDLSRAFDKQLKDFSRRNRECHIIGHNFERQKASGNARERQTKTK